jgi:hypothetical protein
MASLLEYQKNGEMVEPPLYKYMKGNLQGFLNSIPDPSKMTKEEQLNMVANMNPTTGLLGTFIGKGSKLWDAKSHNIAKALEKQGAAPEAIWSQTGNVKAPDGKWRQEIPDNEAIAFQYPKEGNMSYLDKYSQELYNVPYGRLPSSEKGMGGQRDKVIKLADAEMKKYEQVGTTLSHPKLYESYPNLKDIELQQWIGPREGSYYPKGLSNKQPNPYITVGAETPEQLKSTLLHELQHGIQMNEGFARGGSATEFLTPLVKKRDELYGNITELNNKLSNAVGTPEYEKLMNQKLRLIPEVTQYDDMINLKDKAFNQYQRLLGESEARLTQNRIPLTQEQRLQYYPYAQGQYGLDVPYNELIVKGLLK